MAILASMVSSGIMAFQIASPGFWQIPSTGMHAEPSVTIPSNVPAAFGLAIGKFHANEIRSQAALMADALYSFKDFHQVYSFLQKNEHLIPLLEEAYGQAYLHFGSGISLALEVFTDPEGPASEELVAIIRVHLTADQAQQLLVQFDRDWWLEAMPRARHKLIIALEYV
jgi:hypothetical protein